MKNSKSTALKANASTAKLLKVIFPDISTGLLRDGNFLQLVRNHLSALANDSKSSVRLLCHTDEGFVDALNGVKIIVKTMKLASVDELLIYLKEKKEAQRARIFAARPGQRQNSAAPVHRSKDRLSQVIGLFQMSGLSIEMKKSKGADHHASGRLQEVEDSIKKIDPKEQSKLTGGNGRLPASASWRPRLAG